MIIKAGRKQWRGEPRFEGGAILANQKDAVTESMLRAMGSFDENTKFYHKEITILPVFIPPPKGPKH